MANMDEKRARGAILASFEKHREKPGTHFDAEEFLDFLMADGRPLGDVRNGFGGLKRLMAFYDTLQLECAVCLESQDMERSWSVDRLADRILQKKKNLAAQRGIARRRLENAERCLISEPLKFGLFLILPAFFILWGFFSGDWRAGLTLFTLGALVVFGIYNLQRKELAYCRRLLEEISALKAEEPPPAAK
jgi:hypothetical protein